MQILILLTMDIPGMPGSQMGMINLGDVFERGFGGQKKNEKNVCEKTHTHTYLVRKLRSFWIKIK